MGAAYTINSKQEQASEAIKEITKCGAHVSIDALDVADAILNSVLSLRKRGQAIAAWNYPQSKNGLPVFNQLHCNWSARLACRRRIIPICLK